MQASYLPRSSASVRLLLEVAEDRGLPLDACLAGTGLDPAALGDPGNDIWLAQEERLMANLVGLAGEFDDLALEAGCRYLPEMAGVYAFAWMSGRTLRESLDIALRFQALSHLLVTVTKARLPGETAFVFDASALRPEVRKFATDFAMASIWISLGRLVGHPLAGRIEMSHVAAPDGVTRWLGTSPQAVLAATDRIVLTDEFLDLPRAGVDAQARAACERHCEQLLERRRERVGTAELVRVRLTRPGGAQLRMQDVARELQTSVRTLRRELAGEATTFSAIEDSARREKACHLLAEGDAKVADIAVEVGYANAPAFVRAFQRWYGTTPGRWRSLHERPATSEHPPAQHGAVSAPS